METGRSFLTGMDETPSEEAQGKTGDNEEIMSLRKELEEARSTIQRWEVVNNKLLERLQK